MLRRLVQASGSFDSAGWATARGLGATWWANSRSQRCSPISATTGEFAHYGATHYPPSGSVMPKARKRTDEKNKTSEVVPLASRIVAAPFVSAPKQARGRLAAWLSEIAGTASGPALKELLGASPRLRAMVEGLADGSPYLWELASTEPGRLLALLQADPDERLAELLSNTAAALARCTDESEAMRILRRTKAEAALL